MSTILEVNDLVTKFYTLDGVVNAVNGVSFALHEGETLAIVGESGSGKSVTMMSLLGLIPMPPGKIEGGEALFTTEEGTRDLLQLPVDELRNIRGGQIGFVFQDPISTLNPILTIGEQIAETLTRHLGISRDEARERTIRLLAHVGIPDPELRYKAYPFQFSGGMRQRVVIAIAISCTPKIIIADEPTTALDVTVQAQIVDLFRNLRDELGVA
ncbi:MAG: ABC transporter ATP-binding protein, partial [Anaerolineae bacterium]